MIKCEWNEKLREILKKQLYGNSDIIKKNQNDLYEILEIGIKENYILKTSAVDIWWYCASSCTS